MVRLQFMVIVLLLTSCSDQQNQLNVPEQTSDPVYLKVDYLYLSATDQSDAKTDYLVSKLDDQLDREIIKEWSLYKVIAGDPDNSHNYVAIYQVDQFGDMDELLSDESDENSPEIRFSELWQRDHLISPDDQQNPGGNYLTINYFDTRDGTGEHEKMEVDFWGAIHEIRIDLDILNSWGMYTLLYPGGVALDYAYATIDFYDEPADMRESVGLELAEQAHTELTENELTEYFQRTADSRTGYKSELWMKVDGSYGN